MLFITNNLLWQFHRHIFENFRMRRKYTINVKYTYKHIVITRWHWECIACDAITANCAMARKECAGLGRKEKYKAAAAEWVRGVEGKERELNSTHHSEWGRKKTCVFRLFSNCPSRVPVRRTPPRSGLQRTWTSSTEPEGGEQVKVSEAPTAAAVEDGTEVERGGPWVLGPGWYWARRSETLRLLRVGRHFVLFRGAFLREFPAVIYTSPWD